MLECVLCTLDEGIEVRDRTDVHGKNKDTQDDGLDPNQIFVSDGVIFRGLSQFSSQL